jgi:DNA-binding PadR family transcriptional regulator
MAAKRSDRGQRWQRGFLGHYALTVLDRTPIYVHQLSTQIATRSHGLWNPSPGAIYPAFRALEARGLVRAERKAGRRLYYITGAGRRQLSEIRAARAKWAERFGGSWRLMLDMVEPERRVEMALRRVRQALAMSEALVEGEEEQLSRAERAYLRRTVVRELERTATILRTGPSHPPFRHRGKVG